MTAGAEADLAQAPNLLLQKFPARSFVMEVLVDFASQQAGEEAGLLLIGRAYAALAVRHNGSGNQVFFRVNVAERCMR